MISKKEWVALAMSYAAQHDYEEDMWNVTLKTARKFGVGSDFLGASQKSDIIMETVSEILGGEWSYWFYDCDRDYDEYNEGVAYEDGTHPNVHSLEDLYDETIKSEDL